MQKIRIFLFILVFLINSKANAISRKEPPYDVYLRQIIQTFKKQMNEELNLEMCGKGYTINDKIEEFHVYLCTDRRATLQEARTLQLLAINKLAQVINNHKGIQPYLLETPFTSKHIKISINFDGPFGRYFDGTITYLFNITEAPTIPENAHHIFYHACDPVSEDFIDVLKEPYEEALKLAQASPIDNPGVHKTTPLEEISDQVFMKFGKELAEKHSLYLSTVGGNFTNNDIKEIGAKLIFCSRANLEEARKHILLAIDKILNTVNQDPRLKPYLKPYPFPTSGLNVCIEFKQKISGTWGPPSFHDGSMDNVEIKDDLISYYLSPLVKKPTGWDDGETVEFGPSFFAKETYQEAKAF